MNLNLSDDQLALQDTLRRFVTKEYPFSKRRELDRQGASANGFSAEAWKQLAELGLLALPFDETYGGLGGSAIDTMVVMEELGRGLMREPYLGTVVLCGGLINALGTSGQKESLLPAIGSGDLLLALAHYEPHGGRYAPEDVATQASPQGADIQLTGHKTLVLQGAQAQQLIVSAREGDGISLFLVDVTAPGLRITDRPLHDGTRAADIELNNVVVSTSARLGGSGDAGPTLAHAIDKANAALCAEAVGLMSTLNDSTNDYLKTRQQFGAPLASFQVLKHRMVDMFIWTETARSASLLASIRATGGDSEASRWACAAAKVQVSEAARYVGQQAVQLHGGMGVTDEMAVAHLFKRLTCICHLFGDADHHLGYVSERLHQGAGAIQ